MLFRLYVQIYKDMLYIYIYKYMSLPLVKQIAVRHWYNLNFGYYLDILVIDTFLTGLYLSYACYMYLRPLTLVIIAQNQWELCYKSM